MKHVISLHCRSDWIPATQYEFIESKKINGFISNNGALLTNIMQITDDPLDRLLK